MKALQLRSASVACVFALLVTVACSQQPAAGPAAADAPAPKPAPATAPAPAKPSDPQPAAAGASPCGELSQPMCPLQGWMNKNLQKPLDAADLAAVARGLQHVPALVPDPSWNDDSTSGWSALAQAAASTAQAGDLDGTKQACKTCHRTWRKQYKDGFRLRALPN